MVRAWIGRAHPLPFRRSYPPIHVDTSVEYLSVSRYTPTPTRTNSWSPPLANSIFAPEIRESGRFNSGPTSRCFVFCSAGFPRECPVSLRQASSSVAWRWLFNSPDLRNRRPHLPHLPRKATAPILFFGAAEDAADSSAGVSERLTYSHHETPRSSVHTTWLPRGQIQLLLVQFTKHNSFAKSTTDEVLGTLPTRGEVRPD